MSNQNLSWKTVEYSIAQFYNMLSELSTEKIDCDPIGQRPDVESLEKTQGILDTIFRGYDFGELKLRELSAEKQSLEGFKYRSVDGGHRKRAIRLFIQNKCKLGKDSVTYVNGEEVYIGGKYYKELSPEIKEGFGNYMMRFTIYDENMTDAQAGETFRRTNITTDVNHQEMLNSYEDNLVAKFVREISRPIRGLNNSYHDLFEYKSLDPEDRKQYWFQKASKRLRDDEYVTRFLTMLVKNQKSTNWLTCSFSEMEKTFIELGDPKTGSWARDTKLAKQNQKSVIEALDFMLDYARAKKTYSKQLLGGQEFIIVSRLYVYFIRTFGKNGFKVKDWEEFYLSVRSAMDRFLGKDERNLRTDTHKDSKGLRMVCECFRQYLTVHNDQERAQKSVQWLLEEIDIDNCGVVFLDPVRCFPPEMIEQVLRQQDYKCWVTGEPLSIQNAVGGHILAWSDGGKTNIDNCMVCSKEENERMNSMEANMYKIARQQELAKMKK